MTGIASYTNLIAPTRSNQSLRLQRSLDGHVEDLSCKPYDSLEVCLISPECDMSREKHEQHDLYQRND